MSLLVALADTLTSWLISHVGPEWGWVLFFGWGTWQLYCPFENYTTKLQAWHDDFVGQAKDLKTGQIALAEDISSFAETEIDPEKYRELHDRERTVTDDLRHSGD